MKKPKRPPLMPHAERRKLIDAPFLSQVLPKRAWGGVYMSHEGGVPTEGRRTWEITPADESYLRYGRADDGQGD